MYAGVVAHNITFILDTVSGLVRVIVTVNVAPSATGSKLLETDRSSGNAVRTATD